VSLSEPEAPRPALRILTPSANEEDIAAVTAVLQAALGELASQAAMEDSVLPSAWQRSQRPMRSGITPGSGAWRTFS
jgi:hypothetical protein